MDNSGSIKDRNPTDKSYDNYQLMKDFIHSLLDRIDVGIEKTRVAVIRYSNSASVVFTLNRFFTKNAIYEGIQEMGYQGGETNTSGALRMMRNEVFRTDAGDRPEVRNIGLVITDGNSNRDENLTLPEARAAKADGITLFSVGITNQINETELKLIASPPVEDHYYNSTEFYQLDSLLVRLLKDVCKTEDTVRRRKRGAEEAVSEGRSGAGTVLSYIDDI